MCLNANAENIAASHMTAFVVISSTHCVTAYIVCTLNATELYSKRWIQPMFKCLKLAFFLMLSQVSGHINYTLIVIL